MFFIENAHGEEDTILINETAQLPKAPEQIAPSWISSIIPMVLIFVVFYFLLIRPQEKKKKAQDALIEGVKKGEEVMTSSGIFGVVASINDSDNTIYLEIAKDIKIKILKSTIVDILSRQKMSQGDKIVEKKPEKLVEKKSVKKQEKIKSEIK